MQIELLFGTETGTAEFLCEDLAEALEDEATCSLSGMETVDPSTLSGEPFYILVSSTFGSGDVPGTAQTFYEALQKRPDLGHVRFAIFGLGDRTFGDTFNQGSEKIMTEMLACGAKMVGERGLFDASSAEMPEDIAIPWAREILVQLSAEAA